MARLQVTVPPEIHQAMENQCGEAYADSYLSGAIVSEGRLLPYTGVAWQRLKDNAGAVSVLKAKRLTLVKPEIRR